MFGLVFLVAVVAYLAVALFAIGLGWRAGKSKSGSVAGGVLGATLGFLLVYLPVFWNHIPVLLEQHARCRKDAGVTVHLSAGEWVAMNPGIKEDLAGKDLQAASERTNEGNGLERQLVLGGAVIQRTHAIQEEKWGVTFSRREMSLLDARTSAPMWREITYSVGAGQGSLRFWLDGKRCPTPNPREMLPYVRYTHELKEALK